MTTRPRNYQTFFAELKRRHVFRVTAVYGAVAFGILQAADLLVEGLQLSPNVLTTITVVVILGFPIAIILAWAYDLSARGVERTAPAQSGELEAIVAQPGKTLVTSWVGDQAARAGRQVFADNRIGTCRTPSTGSSRTWTTVRESAPPTRTITAYEPTETSCR